MFLLQLNCTPEVVIRRRRVLALACCLRHRRRPCPALAILTCRGRAGDSQQMPGCSYQTTQHGTEGPCDTFTEPSWAPQVPQSAAFLDMVRVKAELCRRIKYMRALRRASGRGTRQADCTLAAWPWANTSVRRAALRHGQLHRGATNWRCTGRLQARVSGAGVRLTQLRSSSAAAAAAL